jgi:voltage-gated sodium channel
MAGKKCKICGKQFKDDHFLQLHMERQHPDKLPKKVELQNQVCKVEPKKEKVEPKKENSPPKKEKVEPQKKVPDVKIPVIPPPTDAEGDAKGQKLAWPEPGDEEPKATPRGGVFQELDPEYIKKQVRQALLTAEPYNVFDFYKETGIWQWLAKHPVFENTTLAVIALNAVYIAVDTDWNKDEPLTPTATKSLTESHAFFQFMEHAFCAYFTAEWITRFMAFKIKQNGRKDGWFVFDSLLVFMMVMETWVLFLVMVASGSSGGSPLGGTSILRLFRLLRLSRLVRMLRSLPELMILIKGMLTAMKSVVYVLCLLVLITYVFAIAFTQLSVGTPTIGEDYFANVAHSMYSLIIYATLLDNLSAFMDGLRYEMWPLLVLAIIFIALAALTVMNMLIGVLCEVVQAVADTERASIQIEAAKEQMLAVVESLDINENKHISYKEFIKIVEKPEALQALEEVDVSAVGLIDFAELFFFDNGEPIELTFEEFMENVLNLQASNNATVKDMFDLWKRMKTSTNMDINGMKTTIKVLSDRFDEQFSKMQERTNKVEEMVGEFAKEVMRCNFA